MNEPEPELDEEDREYAAYVARVRATSYLGASADRQSFGHDQFSWVTDHLANMNAYLAANALSYYNDNDFYEVEDETDGADNIPDRYPSTALSKRLASISTDISPEDTDKYHPVGETRLCARFVELGPADYDDDAEDYIEPSDACHDSDSESDASSSSGSSSTAPSTPATSIYASSLCSNFNKFDGFDDEDEEDEEDLPVWRPSFVPKLENEDDWSPELRECMQRAREAVVARRGALQQQH